MRLRNLLSSTARKWQNKMSAPGTGVRVQTLSHSLVRQEYRQCCMLEQQRETTGKRKAHPSTSGPTWILWVCG